MDFTGKRVLITGSTGGLGRSAAEMFHAAGAHVAINGRTAESVAAAIAGLGGQRLVAAPGDVGTVNGCRAVVEAAFAGLGGLDCLVNNVGVNSLAGMMEVSEAHWDRVMAVNLRSAMFCSQYALPALRASRGNIVIVASVAGMLAGPTESFVYAVAKGGLISLTKSLALELATDGIRVNCLCPGYIDTPAVRAVNQANNGRIDGFVNAATPLGRLGTMRECASSILYFASDDASYCTGSILVNDGGSFANASLGTRTAPSAAVGSPGEAQ
jgi:NAD(P)-dependent dehydrogenase (short-subunit alcohol dehydrogenase family)